MYVWALSLLFVAGVLASKNKTKLSYCKYLGAVILFFLFFWNTMIYRGNFTPPPPPPLSKFFFGHAKAYVARVISLSTSANALVPDSLVKLKKK